MAISLQLDDEFSRRLQQAADRLQVDPSDLARAAINEFLSTPESEFESAARYVLIKNQKLYERLK